MNKDDADDVINNLISLSNGIISPETFKEILIPNYTDTNGNSYFHFLTEYSFQEFCLRNMKLNKKENMSFAKYKELKNEYAQQIKFFIQILLELNCDLIYVNKNNESPLLLSINNNNYIMSKEFLKILQNIGIFINEDYYNFLDIISKNGNCFNEDCIELMSLLVSNIAENYDMETSKQKLTNIIISLCKNYSKNVYEQYNNIVKIVSLDYLNKKEDDNFTLLNQEENNEQKIKKQSLEYINDYINNNFIPLLIQLIKFGGDIQYKKESVLIYLMSFPLFLDFQNYIGENNVNINFQDESGNTPLITLINKKGYIIQISKEIYENGFKYLIDNKNLDIQKKNNKGESVFDLCIMKEYYKEVKLIYHAFKKNNLSYFNSIILNFIFTNENTKIIKKFLNELRDEIDFNLFNNEQKRSLIHYICLYLSDDKYINYFIQLFSFIENLKIDQSLKDIYERNCLFYLFLDQNDNNKINDPIQQLIIIFQKYKFNNLNDKDIFGNYLLFYVIQSKAEKCLEFFLNNGIIISSEQPNNENSIFSISLLDKNIILFNYLYDKIKDPNIFSHIIYEPYKLNQLNKENVNIDKYQKGETLYDFLNANNFEKNEKYE